MRVVATIVCALTIMTFCSAGAVAGLAASTGATNAVGPGPGAVAPEPLTVACADANQCTVVGGSQGNAVTFDPSTPQEQSVTDLGATSEVFAVACPLQTLCVAVGGDTIVAFNPVKHATLWRRAVRQRFFQAVACHAASHCTAVGSGGMAVTFAPLAGALPVTQARVDTHGIPETLNGIACPTSRVCVAVDDSYLGGVTKFEPGAAGAAQWTSLDKGGSLYGIACPSQYACVTVDNRGREIAFSLRSLETQRETNLHVGGLAGVACPTTTQCTALASVTASGASLPITFDPHAASRVRAFSVDPHPGGSELACPDATECVTIDQDSDLVVFDPENPKKSATITLVR
jgi:hypothetical protein